MENTTLKPFGMRDKIGYALGDLGCNMSFQFVSSYMFLFYTQCIGLSTKSWAWIIIVSKIWDAINDVIIGGLVDNKQISKKSKFKPWITIGSIGLVAFTVLIFVPIHDLSELGKILWCLVSYCLWSVAYTMVNVPYGSLHSVITSDPKQRTTLSTFRSIGAGTAMILVMLLPKIVYKDNQLHANTVFLVSVILSVVSFFIFIFMKRMVVERVQRTEVHQKTNYFAAVKSFFTNRAMIAITIVTVACVIFFTASSTINNLVFQFYFGDAGKSSLAMIASYGSYVILMPLAGKIVSKIGKKSFICISSAIGFLAGVIMLFLPIAQNNSGIALYIIGLLFVNIGHSVFQIIVWAIVADCIELSYRKSGMREEGSLYAIYSFFRKLSQGIGSAVVALALGAIGYVETATVQTPQVAANIKNLYLLFMIVGLAIMFLAMKFIYNINYEQEQSFMNEYTKEELQTF